MSPDWALMMSSLCTMLTATNSSLNMWIYLNKVAQYLNKVALHLNNVA